MVRIALGVPTPVGSKLSCVPAIKVITPLTGLSNTLTVEVKLEGIIFGLLNSALISTGVTIVLLGPRTPIAGTIITSFQLTLVKALVLISSIMPIGAVPLLTVAITWLPITVSSATRPG